MVSAPALHLQIPGFPSQGDLEEGVALVSSLGSLKCE